MEATGFVVLFYPANEANWDRERHPTLVGFFRVAECTILALTSTQKLAVKPIEGPTNLRELGLGRSTCPEFALDR